MCNLCLTLLQSPCPKIPKRLTTPSVRGIISLARKSPYAPVAQLDRVSDSDSEGHAFESHRAYQLSPHVLIQSMRTSFCIYRPINRRNIGYNRQIQVMDARNRSPDAILPDKGFHSPALFSLLTPIFRGRNQRFIMECTLLWTIAGYRPQCEVSSTVSRNSA